MRDPYLLPVKACGCPQDASPSFYTKPMHVYAATLRRNIPNPLATKALSDTFAVLVSVSLTHQHKNATCRRGQSDRLARGKPSRLRKVHAALSVTT
jgi:hypothetical protein